MGLLLKPARRARTQFELGGPTRPQPRDKNSDANMPRQPGRMSNASVDTVRYSSEVVELETYSIEVLPARNDRRALEIQNPTASPVYVNIGGRAGDGPPSRTIGAGGYWSPPKAPAGAIHILGSYADQKIMVSEGY